MTERVPPILIAQKRYDGIGECSGIIRGLKMLAGLQAKPFRADRCRHDGLPHGECFENLQTRAAAGT